MSRSPRAGQAATVTAASVLAPADSLGVVEIGYRADLVLLEGNPLDDIANVRGVVGIVLDGRYVDRAELDVMVRDALAAGR